MNYKITHKEGLELNDNVTSAAYAALLRVARLAREDKYEYPTGENGFDVVEMLSEALKEVEHLL